MSLNYQIRELERAELKPGEDEELDTRKKLLRGAGKLMDGLQSASFALSGNEDRQGACDLIADAEGDLREFPASALRWRNWASQLTALRGSG